MESLQASLETEQRNKSEGLRIKKKLESEINEYEIALDHANKVNNEALKSIKRYQGQYREAETPRVPTRRCPRRPALLTAEPTPSRES